MKEKIFTLSEIERAIFQCPPHKVHIDARPSVDDGFVGDIETIETEFFLYRLFKSNMDEYQKYKNSKQVMTEEQIVINRKELLISFATFMESNFFSDTAMTPEQLVDEYEREINIKWA